MQFLVLVSLTTPTPKDAPTQEEREAESEVIRQLYRDGIVRQIWLRDDGGACIIAEGDAPQTLDAVFSALPLVRSGFLQPPRVTALKAYSGFGPKAAL
ncbi:hypothetical protein A6V36_26500 [Paraburkholderia ginsengiterrae]|uniref:Muconolactone isomerase domain-containing protein n=1 Tax=Paraburkholderia ginsengiterrae TaxID=1462993 RepID=A0A1A9MX80_9BURK|nr:hypothetical protein [Paraburkholderia ginsengiterrae]OAJ51727.1 hypothetical protein A6V37_37280 [Paraburkholderia ginsengiterrae]OAJ59913.1 hypothetical protein A6V36_26500 [Paraburkholderia ginsengiterrae]